MAKVHFTSNMPDTQVSLFSKDDLYLFNEGTHFHLFEKLGAHPLEQNGVTGTYFAVWAPNAGEVSVIGASTIGGREPTPCRRSPNPEFGKDLSQVSVEARSTSFISEHEAATMRSIRPIPSPSLTKFLPRLRRLSGTLSTRGRITPGWNTGISGMR